MLQPRRPAILVSAALWSLLAVVPHASAGPSAPAAAGGSAPAASQSDEEDAPVPAPLTVGSMALASDNDLAIEAMAVDIALDRVAYSYRLNNTGKAKLSLAASVALPDLEVNSEGNTVYMLPAQTPENPVNLTVKANDQAVATTANLSAIALGVDRQADLKAAGIPLIPFGSATDKALVAAKPDTLARLQSLGLVPPRDKDQPGAPLIGDWSLHVVHTWMQGLDPGAVTNLVVSFAPIRATYRIDAAGLTAFNVLKDQVCLTPAATAAARNLLKAKDAVAQVDDITVANDGPARWLDNPAASVAVRKPQPNSVVVFCGMDAASAGKPVVTGKMPGSSDAAGLRVLVFSAAGS